MEFKRIHLIFREFGKLKWYRLPGQGLQEPHQVGFLFGSQVERFDERTQIRIGSTASAETVAREARGPAGLSCLFGLFGLFGRTRLTR
jgi:hypothetical protein